MKTTKEAREAKSRLITQKKMMESLQQDDGFKLLTENLQKITKDAKQDLYNAKDWEDYIQKRAYYDGLMALSREVEAIINRGRRAELTSK